MITHEFRLPYASADPSHYNHPVLRHCSEGWHLNDQVAVNEASHPELLAGMRGAGTVFGIVTELTLRLFDGIDSVYAGNLMLADDAKHSTFRYIQVYAVSVSVL